MANKDCPCGFTAYGPVLRARAYDINATPTVYVGDLIIKGSDGYVDPATAGSTYIVGVSPSYNAATAGTIIVFDDPQQLFRGQADGSDLSAITVLGNNADHIAGAGSSYTYRSGHEIDSDTVTAGAASLHLHRKVPSVDNAWGANVEMVVSIYEHMLGVTGGTGYV